MKGVLDRHDIHGSKNVFISGTLSGMATALITNPVWVLKTRIQLQGIGNFKKYDNTFSMYLYNILYSLADQDLNADAITCIAKEEGITAFWKGIVPSLLSSYHGAVQFMIFELAHKHFSAKNEDGKMSGVEA